LKVRTQLITAFSLLAALPLAGNVLYSYAMSKRAFSQAVEVESGNLVEEIRGRMTSLRGDLEGTMNDLGRLPLTELSGRGDGITMAETYLELMETLGDSAGLFDCLEVTPVLSATGDMPERWFIYPSTTIESALRKVLKQRRYFAPDEISDQFLSIVIGKGVVDEGFLTPSELASLELRTNQTTQLLGDGFGAPVLVDGMPVAHLTAAVSPSQVLQIVLARTPRSDGDIPFAIDEDGNVFVDNVRDKSTFAEVPISDAPRAAFEPVATASDNWIVVQARDPNGRITFGIARPVGQTLREIRQTSVRNFSYGLGILGLAMIGILIISDRMTRNLHKLTEGAEALALGDLTTRINVRSRDEFNQLSGTINRMAQELSDKQRKLVTEEHIRREQAVQQRLLEAENERQTLELEDARDFQLSLLPKELPQHPRLDIAVLMRTATEVGGDYYDFFGDQDQMTVAIGDATGHGAKAGTLVSVVKGLLSAQASGDELPTILKKASHAIRRMALSRMHMALCLARFEGDSVCLASAGIPPVLIHRKTSGTVEEITLGAPPLGAPQRSEYATWKGALEAGDTLLLMTDGLPELLDPTGEPLGYPGAIEAFAKAAAAATTAQGVIDSLSEKAHSWSKSETPQDDITFVVLRVRGTAG